MRELYFHVTQRLHEKTRLGTDTIIDHTTLPTNVALVSKDLSPLLFNPGS